MVTILINDTEDKFIARDKDEIVASLDFYFDNRVMHITKLEGEEFFFDGLCRSAMNYACNRYINECVYDIEDTAILSKLCELGFVQNNNKTISDIDNFFTLHKSCGKS